MKTMTTHSMPSCTPFCMSPMAGMMKNSGRTRTGMLPREKFKQHKPNAIVAPVSDLIRQLRHGGPMALAAAKRLLEAKPKLTLAEAAEVKLLLPQLKDLFGAKLSEGLSTMLSGLEVAVPVPVELLMPELSKVKNPE